MDDQLIHQVNTWMHYVGGSYKSTDHFVREAQHHGISRRIPAQVARGMAYGDRVVMLRWGGPDCVTAFAEMTITKLVLDSDMADKVGERLREQGKAAYTQGGETIQRECGSYFICGTWHVDAEISEVMDIAIQIAEAEGRSVFVMVGGTLTKTYADPILLQPAPKFTRGFIRADNEAMFVMHDEHEPERQVVSISGYAKSSGRKRSKHDAQAVLPIV